ncbi:Sec-independent protein translocase subunit TatA [Streptomyces sp. NPDC058195]|uniref:Sec-independent protein translocase subunit TatA n=1 Tax=Streptomyces sp. NPDC058195 TaxID=3346375 RepID=UPI0036F08264
MLRNGLEPWHLLIVAIVLFGSTKLPDTARALGKSMRILKSEAKAMKETGTQAPRTGTQMTHEAPAPRTEPHVERTGRRREAAHQRSLHGLRKHGNHGHGTAVDLVTAPAVPSPIRWTTGSMEEVSWV